MTTKNDGLFADYMTWDEVCKECGRTKRSIERWQAKYGFPRPVRTPAGMLFPRRRIVEWIGRREREAYKLSRFDAATAAA